MQISELITRLEQLREQVGDVHVEVLNSSGDYDIAEAADISNVAREHGTVKWCVFIYA